MIRILSDGSTRDIQPAEFPFAIGLSADGAAVYGVEAESAPVLWLRNHDDRIYVQPENNRVPVSHNDMPVDGSVWLNPGDRIGFGEIVLNVGDADGLLTLSPEVGDNELPDDSVGKVADAAPRGPSRPASPPPDEKPDIAAPQSAPRRRWARSHKAILAVFILLLLGVGFVLTASPVRVAINPQPQSDRFSGTIPAIWIGGRYLALPGDYTVTATLPGYRPLEEKVSVTFGSQPDLKFEMKKLRGLLSVTTTPVEGAQIKIDGKFGGFTPVTGIELAPGTHTVSIAADRYIPVERKIDIKGAGEKQTISVDLEQAWGTLIVRTEPTGAILTLNGETIGKTPKTFEPLRGKHRYKLSRDGWKPETGTVLIEAGKLKILPLIKLERVDGKLIVTSKPSGATIEIDKIYNGRTPQTLALVSGKSYRVGLTKPGYVSADVNVEIDGRKRHPLHVVLKPEYGIVFLKTRPAGATLKVDGRAVGSASRRLRLTTQSHRLEISKPGYLKQVVTVTPRPGISKRLNIALKRQIDVQREKAREVITTPSGHTVRMVLIEKPVGFTVGASRREAGRRSNETQYKVELSRSFVIGTREVTNGEFRRFRPKHSSGAGLDGARQPVANVSWHDAARYLNWLSAKEGFEPAYRESGGRMKAVVPLTNGYRLPTEAEWAYVARYDAGKRSTGNARKYSWGKALPPTPNSGNFADSSAAGRLPFVIRGYSDGYPDAAPVGSFPANTFEIQDLAGNVAEWCHDFYDSFIGGASGARRDPTGPSSGEFHVVRGSSWRHGTITELRLSYRDYAKSPRDDLGFRIARYVKIPK